MLIECFHRKWVPLYENSKYLILKEASVSRFQKFKRTSERNKNDLKINSHLSSAERVKMKMYADLSLQGVLSRCLFLPPPLSVTFITVILPMVNVKGNLDKSNRGKKRRGRRGRRGGGG